MSPTTLPGGVIFPAETFLTAIRCALRDEAAVIPLNETAFAKGAEAARASIR